MPFNYNSFLKGVITGMRLPRVPGGKPPFTPVPSGIYILTESGERIITELPYTPECTIYKEGTYYLTSSQHYTPLDVEMYVEVRRTDSDSLGGYFFFADNLDESHYSLVFFGTPTTYSGSWDQIRGDVGQRYVSYRNGVIVEDVSWVSIGVSDTRYGHSNVVWAVNKEVEEKNTHDPRYRIPLDATMWHGNEDELEDFVRSLVQAYMITE